MIKSFLTDLDGCMVNMVEGHYISLNKALRHLCSFELSRKEHFEDFNGLTTKTKLDKLIEQNRIKIEDKEKIFSLKQDYTKETINEIITVDESKVELLRYIKSLGLKTACVTNSIRDTGVFMMQKVGIYDLLDFTVCNTDVKYPKPNSEGWIHSLVKFNCYPSETIICEDSEHGVRSAVNTGSYVWKVSGPEEVNLENFKKFKESIEC